MALAMERHPDKLKEFCDVVVADTPGGHKLLAANGNAAMAHGSESSGEGKAGSSEKGEDSIPRIAIDDGGDDSEHDIARDREKIEDAPSIIIDEKMNIPASVPRS